MKKNGWRKDGFYSNGEKLRRDIPLQKGPSFISRFLSQQQIMIDIGKSALRGLILAIVTTVVLIYTVFAADSNPPTLELLGDFDEDYPHIVQIGTPYIEPGVMCFDEEDPNCTYEVLSNDIDHTTEGSYTVTYIGSDRFGNVSDVYTRHVLVSNKPGIRDVINNQYYNNDVMPRFTFGIGALSKDGGEDRLFVSGDVISEEGTYTLNVRTTVEDGEDADPVTFVIDKTAPVISDTLNTLTYYADNIIHLYRGQTVPNWNSLFSITDNFTTGLTPIIGGDTVDTDAPGDYTKTITSTDLAGNETVINLTVRVYDWVSVKNTWDGNLHDEYFTLEWLAPKYATVTLNHEPYTSSGFNEIHNSVNNQSVSSININSDGTYRVTLDYSIWPGRSFDFLFEVDDTPPVITPTSSYPTNITWGDNIVFENYFSIFDDRDKAIPSNFDNIDFKFTNGDHYYEDITKCQGDWIVEYDAYDAAGNQSSDSFIVTVDPNPSNILGVCDGVAYPGNITPTFSGTATYKLNNGGNTPITSGTPLTQEGNYVLTVNGDVVNFRIDKTDPVITVNPTYSSKLFYRGQSEIDWDDDFFVCTDNLSGILDIGSWRIDTDFDRHSTGTYYVETTCEDDAGNQSTRRENVKVIDPNLTGFSNNQTFNLSDSIFINKANTEGATVQIQIKKNSGSWTNYTPGNNANNGVGNYQVRMRVTVSTGTHTSSVSRFSIT